MFHQPSPLSSISLRVRSSLRITLAFATWSPDTRRSTHVVGRPVPPGMALVAISATRARKDPARPVVPQRPPCRRCPVRHREHVCWLTPQPSADIGHVHALPNRYVSLPKQAHELLRTASLLHQRTLSSPSQGTRILSQDLDQDLGRGSDVTSEPACSGPVRSVPSRRDPAISVHRPESLRRSWLKNPKLRGRGRRPCAVSVHSASRMLWR
jgi:hypothetical protein